MFNVKSTFNLKDFEKRVRSGLLMYGDTSAKKLEADAKKNRPWKDQTGNARNSIQGDSYFKSDTLVIRLSGNVDYFQYLELAMDKRYAILKPTVDKNGPEIFKGYKIVRGG